MNKKIRVVITSGYGKSLHSIALMHELLCNNNLQVVGCVQIKMLQYNRFRQYLKQYGWKTLKSKFFSYILGSKKNLFKQ